MLFRLDDIADIGLGASTHGRSVVGQGESFMPIINIRDVRDGYIDYAGIEDISVVDEQKTSRYQVQDRDIVITLRGSDFRAALVESLRKKTLISSNLAYLRLKDGAPISPVALCAWLNSAGGRNQAELLQHGSGILSISAKDLKNMPVSIPDKATQSKLEELMRVGMEYKQLNEQIYRKREMVLEAAIAGCFKMKFKYTKECA